MTYEKKSKRWTTSNIPPQSGRRVIITGATSGIGWETALQLARAGAYVVLTARTTAKGEDAVDRIRSIFPSARIRPSILDLASFQSIREFAAREGDQPLDLLVNNAGAMATKRRELTVDGFERTFATNYLGPFALTGLLLPALLRTDEARVVTVASAASKQGKIDLNDLQSDRHYKLTASYARSKLAGLIFAIELQRRIDVTKTPLVSVACHPGYAITNLQNSELSLGMAVLAAILRPWASQDAAHGALPTLFAATSSEAQPGGYYGPDGPLEAKGFPVPVPIPKRARNTELAKRLWSISEQLTGVSFGLLSRVP